MRDPEAERRAVERRTRTTVRRTSLHGPHEDTDVVRGEEALSLVTRLTREGWSLAGLPFPEYERTSIPVRFVRRTAT